MGLPTIRVATPEVEPTKLASPEYVAVMLSVPVGNCVVVSVAIKFFNGTGTLKAVLPVKNWTVPVGSIAPLGNTIACRITELFGKAPVGRKRIVCVGPFATLIVIGPALLAEKLASPE